MRHVKKRYDKKSISSIGMTENGNDAQRFFVVPTSVIKKHEPAIFVYKKKRPISRNDNSSNWNMEDAQKAIFLEQMFIERQQKNQVLVISFPDQPLSSSIVRGFSSNIDSVNFVQSFAPRSCYVTLKTGSDVKEEISKISQIPFQNGFLKVKIKSAFQAESPPIPREVDPSTLYVGNLPPDISIHEIKEHFPRAVRIEVGYSVKRKWRRYALVKYSSAEEAMRAFAVSSESHIRSASLIIRFHRVKQWKILEEMEAQNEITSLKIKKEKVDEEYESAIRRAQIGSRSFEALNDSAATLAPAQYPIARPLIDPSMIKEEPYTPEHVTDEAPQNVNTWSRCMQYFQYMMINQSQGEKKSYLSHQQQDGHQQQLIQLVQQQDQITDSNLTIWKKKLPGSMSNTEPITSQNIADKNLGFQQMCSNDEAVLKNTSALLKKDTTNTGPNKIDIMKLPRIPKKHRPTNTSQGLVNQSSTKQMEVINNSSLTEIAHRTPIHRLAQKFSNFADSNGCNPQEVNKGSYEIRVKKRKRTFK